MLELQGIKKDFGGIAAIDGCSFVVPERSITALIGPNGAGKTTVFNCISGLEHVDDGLMLWKNDPMNSWWVHERAHAGVSRTFQLLRVFENLSVFENVALGIQRRDHYLLPSFFGFVRMDAEHERAVDAALERVQLTHMKNSRAGDLSYGQQKLLSLARALAQPHALLMLDEPVAGVNPEIRKTFSELLKLLREKGESIFLIEHDMRFVMDVADKIIVMNEGKVLMQGAPDEVRANEEVLRVYLGK